VVGFQDDVSAAAAVAPAGTALGPVSFALKRNAPFAAVAGLGEHFDLVDEHGMASVIKKARPEASPSND